MPQRVLGVLGGNDVDDAVVRAWASSADVIYAADSGADRVIALGFSPVVVGDFDSFADLPRASHLRLVRSSDQSSTDCDKLLALVRNDGHSAVTLVATEGDLPDHVLATYSSAIASGLDVRFGFRRGIGVLVRDRAVVQASEGQRVSLVALTPATDVGLTGVKWPVRQARFEPGGAQSVSNEALGGAVAATLAAGCALLFLETSEAGWWE